jgi:uncharacterized protein with NRDE domain
MCLTALSFRTSECYPFVLIHNRDEYFQRSFQAAHFWEEYPFILAGKDEPSQGTWLGVSRTGFFGTVTNFRDPNHFNPHAPSRGSLVKDFLIGSFKCRHWGPSEYIQSNRDHIQQMNAFNLIFGDFNSPWYFSSREKILNPLTPGIHGLSNSNLNVPWPKVSLAKNEMIKVLENSKTFNKTELIYSLFDLLEDRTPAPDEDLPSTGLDIERERALSSIFVATPIYGTMTSTVVIQENNGRVSFAERTFKNSLKTGENFLEFVTEPQGT